MYQMYKPTSGCVALNRVGRASPVVPGLSPHPVWSQHFSLGTVVRGCSHREDSFPTEGSAARAVFAVGNVSGLHLSFSGAERAFRSLQQ